MPCEKCGCAVRITHADEPQDSGAFKEEYECANGHKGFIHGQEGELPENWSRFGQVFE